jgi:hypothetical protein
MPRKIQVNKTTGFRPDVLGAIVARCEKENREWNDVIDEVLRKGLEMDTGDDTQTEGDKEYGRI